VVSRALQVRPEDRYPEAAAMREDLEAVALAQGLSVGQASLAGYVQEQSGEFSVIPTGVKRLRPSAINVPNVPSRTRVPTLLSRQPVRAALGVVTALALVGGGFAAWKLWVAPQLPMEDAVAVSPPPPVAEPLKAPEPAAAEPASPAESESAVEVGSTPREGEVVPAPKPGRERTRREPRRTAKPVVAASAPVAEKPPEPEEVLTGEGTLRIRATTEGQVEVKLPGLGRVVLPVLNQRIAAGKHTAEFFMEGGSTARCTLIVRPDRRTIATFNGKTCSTE
jgi:hypothetical protein